MESRLIHAGHHKTRGPDLKQLEWYAFDNQENSVSEKCSVWGAGLRVEFVVASRP